MAEAIMPDRWGEGKLFTFSGLDGPTSWAHTLVASASREPLGLRLRLSPDLLLSFGAGIDSIKARLVLGDAADLSAETAGGIGDVKFAFADCGTIVGATKGTLEVRLEGDPNTQAGFVHLEIAPAGDGQRFCLALSPQSLQQARDRAVAGIELDIDKLTGMRSAFIRNLDCSGLLADADEQTYRKCAEVLKLNVRAPEGQIRRRWTTPDVWPHRYMWLWDSAFHSLGWLHIDSEMAKDSILAVTESQLADGYIAHCITAEGHSEVTQPPILAWAAWKVYQATGDDNFLRACYQPLCRFIEWLLRERDANDNGLLEWHKDMSSERCKCGESGWDNSPRFDRPIIDDHIDLNSFVVGEMQWLAQMADVLGRGEAEQWRRRAQELSALVNDRLWNEELGIYLDRGPDPEGKWMLLKTGADFLPMLAGIPDANQVQRLVAHLTDSDEFWPQLPVPTVALDEPAFSDDMWRGPVWMNINYLIWEGLRVCGEDEVAAALRARSMRAIEKWYRQTGVVFEYYDPHNQIHPHQLHRKGQVGDTGGPGFGVIRDYGWTAATYISWAHNC